MMKSLKMTDIRQQVVSKEQEIIPLPPMKNNGNSAD